MSRQDSRERIVRTARRLFYTQGFEKTSLGELARESGVPKGNFYYHFPSKDDVLRAVVEARLADIRAALNEWGEAFSNPMDRLNRFLTMLSVEREDLSSYGCPTGSLLTELGKRRDDLQPNALQIMELYTSFLSRNFEDLGHAPDRARILALSVLARAQGAILMAHAYRDQELLMREIEDLKVFCAEQTPNAP